MLALTMCGHSPAKIGTVMWEEHPTVKALITMVTASRFRFPTIDCDETARAEMRRLDKEARGNVSRDGSREVFAHRLSSNVLQRFLLPGNKHSRVPLSTT